MKNAQRSVAIKIDSKILISFFFFVLSTILFSMSAEIHSRAIFIGRWIRIGIFDYAERA